MDNGARIAQIMTRAPAFCSPEDTLTTADALLQAGSFRHLPVLERDALVGVVSERDLLAASLAPQPTARSFDEQRVRQHMAAAPFVAAPQDELRRVCHLMLRHKISSIPVVHQGELVGIATATDLVRLASARWHRAAAVDRPRVAETMTKTFESIEATATLDSVGLLMVRDRLRDVPVTQGERLIGLLGERTLRAAMLRTRGDGSFAEPCAGDIMTSPAPTIDRDAMADEAASLLIDLSIGALPVVADGTLVGLFTESDAMRSLLAPVARVSSRGTHYVL